VSPFVKGVLVGVAATFIVSFLLVKMW